MYCNNTFLCPPHIGINMELQGYAVGKPKGELSEHTYEDEVGPTDVKVKITHCGICHSDIHLIDDEWGMSEFPFIPGHEIIGEVEEVGEHVTHLQKGQRVGVGWQCNSCHHCEYCMKGKHENCPKQQPTCVGRNGGFAHGIIVDADFAIPVPEGMNSASTAPMLCGGITVYKPLREYASAADKVAVVGIGGLGHFAVQFANALGCEVTAITTHPEQEDELYQLGAETVIDAKDEEQLKDAQNSFDVIINTAPASLNWGAYIQTLRPEGVFVQVGAGPTMNLEPFGLLAADRKVVGSHIGSPALIAEMLRFADEQGITAHIEEFGVSEINKAVEHSRQGKAQFRAVLNMSK